LAGAVDPAAVKSTAEFGPEEDNLPNTVLCPFTTPWALARLASVNSAKARVVTIMFMVYEQLLSRP
jgi:hypothetical protein